MYQLTQHKFWGVLALIISIMFVAFMVTGCGGNDDDDDDTGTGDTGDTGEDLPPPATSVQVTPPGGTVPSNQTFTLVFDQGIESATVNGAAAQGSGKNWTASPALSEGDGVMLNIAWKNKDGSDNSSTAGPYTVDDPDTEAPKITGGTITDGAADVDPAPINAGTLEITFDEDVTGSVELQDEAGANLNWIGAVAGSAAVLTPVAGQELANETTYKVVLAVQDGAGNKTDATLTFVTKPKE